MTDLIFGRIEFNSYGRIIFQYNAPGYGANVVLDKAQMESQAEMLKQSALRSINYLNIYTKFIAEGKAVAKCVKAQFMVADNPTLAQGACVQWQGGFEKLYTAEDIEEMKAPYRRMLEDYAAIAKFLSEIPSPIPALKAKPTLSQRIKNWLRWG